MRVVMAARAVAVVLDLAARAQGRAAQATRHLLHHLKETTVAQELMAPAVLRLLAVVAVLPQLVKPRPAQDKAVMAALARHRQSLAAP